VTILPQGEVKRCGFPIRRHTLRWRSECRLGHRKGELSLRGRADQGPANRSWAVSRPFTRKSWSNAPLRCTIHANACDCADPHALAHRPVHHDFSCTTPHHV